MSRRYKIQYLSKEDVFEISDETGKFLTILQTSAEVAKYLIDHCEVMVAAEESLPSIGGVA